MIFQLIAISMMNFQRAVHQLDFDFCVLPSQFFLSVSENRQFFFGFLSWFYSGDSIFFYFLYFRSYLQHTCFHYSELLICSYFYGWKKILLFSF
ncbi:hypothetical protein TRFO_34966 [Tritrichomonas foetus]|uniref:Uncharacterized protein n=1 Tax=Tritrichomonas foetus TaxID=1144522 RepID=A0A1J4JJV1_9EUKA|nr:hypothetical protein TRFO_34966 [Tritrichomonas foetus]|eukprot:OHS98631.1 hypothetical protein TRFO_34966 [Tritrichomonas foetus]